MAAKKGETVLKKFALEARDAMRYLFPYFFLQRIDG